MVLTEKAEERCVNRLQPGAPFPLTNLCARAFKFEKESDRSRHDELKYRSSVCRGDMGEDREIGASVLAGVRAARPPSPEEAGAEVFGQAGQRRPRASHAAGTGVVRREWRARAEPRCPGAGSARSAALAPLRVRATCAAVPPSRAAGACARWVGVRPCPASSRRHRPQIPNRCQVRRCGHVAFFLRDKHTRRSPAGPAARRQTRAPCHRDGAAHAAPLRECPVDEPLGPACSRSSH